MSRTAKPIETLLKLKQIKPDIEFSGADAIAYQNFCDEQAEENLLSTLKETEDKPKKKTTKRKTTKKVKQTIDPEIVETGEVEPINEAIDIEDQEEIRAEESN